MFTLHEKIYLLDNFKTTKILNCACTKRHFLRVIKMAWANPGPHGPRLKKARSAKKAHSAKKSTKSLDQGWSMDLKCQYHEIFLILKSKSVKNNFDGGQPKTTQIEVGQKQSWQSQLKTVQTKVAKINLNRVDKKLSYPRLVKNNPSQCRPK